MTTSAQAPEHRAGGNRAKAWLHADVATSAWQARCQRIYFGWLRFVENPDFDNLELEWRRPVSRPAHDGVGLEADPPSYRRREPVNSFLERARIERLGGGHHVVLLVLELEVLSDLFARTGAQVVESVSESRDRVLG